MDCKRFEDQLMDAALGGRLPERETELRMHLRECAACRGEFVQRQQLVTAMDRSLDQMAAVEPSPEMEARIRVKIAEQPAPSRGWLAGWWPAAAGALAAAALVAYLMIPKSTVQPPRESGPTATTSPQPPPQVAKAVPPVAAKPSRQPRRLAAVAVAETRPAATEVLVPGDQERAVAWLYRAMRREPQRMGDLLAQVAAQAEAGSAPIRIQQLQTAPLEIAPIQPALDSTSSETK